MKEIGVIVPISTPCLPDGKVDVDGLRVLSQDMVKSGCHGFFVAGSTGRGPWFGRENRMEICKSVSDVIGSERPLLAGCMAAGLGDMLENARVMFDSGATMAVATSPMYFPYSADEVEYIFLKFADLSPLPVIIYDIPELAGIDIDPKLLLKLSRHQNIVGFKDSSANYDNFKKLLEVLNDDNPDFYLMQGKEHLLRDSLIAGASGLVVSLVHVEPRLFVSLYDAVKNGDNKKADLLQDAVTGVMECLKECFEIKKTFSTLSHFLNTALNERGVDVNICLDHEGECPEWITKKATKAIETAQRVINE